MAELVPISFPVPTEAAIASYSYTDVAEGTGIITFYGASHQEESTEAYFLTQNEVYSNSVNTTIAIAETSFTKVIDHDYDLVFNLPKRIKGKARCNITIAGGDSNSANTSGEVYAIIKIRHYDGSTETEVASGQSETLAFESSANTSKTMCVEIDVSTARHYKKGETLRITVEIWAKKTAANSTWVGYGHDPKDRNVDVVVDYGSLPEDDYTKQLLFYIPFILDL